jgi:integrase
MVFEPLRPLSLLRNSWEPRRPASALTAVSRTDRLRSLLAAISLRDGSGSITESANESVPKRAQDGTLPTFDGIVLLVKSSKRRRVPSTVNGTVPPRVTAYGTRRPREYLTVKEVGRLMEAARDRGRYGHRDATMILIAYRHGLRGACGYKLANDGQDTRAVQHYLGHKNIQHTVRYTELLPERFKSFWED